MSKFPVLVFICCLCRLPNSVMGAAGELDPTYGCDGTVTTNFFSSDTIRELPSNLTARWS